MKLKMFIAGFAVLIASGVSADLVSFQQGDLSLNGAGVSGAYQTDVTYIRSGGPDTVNDNASYAYIGTTSATDFRHMLMGFDVSYLDTLIGGNEYTINSVQLKLTQYNDATGSATSTFAMHLTDAFDEATATWNNSGTVGALLSTAPIDCATSLQGDIHTFTGANWITAVESALSDPSKTLNVLGKRNVEGGAGSYYVFIQSDEGAANGINGRPELLVDITVIPEPATVGLLGMGALVALLVRKIRG